jgi:hypothetical protein
MRLKTQQQKSVDLTVGAVEKDWISTGGLERQPLLMVLEEVPELFSSCWTYQRQLMLVYSWLVKLDVLLAKHSQIRN